MNDETQQFLLGKAALTLALAVTGHDLRLVTLLDTANLLPEDVWQRWQTHGGTP